MSDIKDDGGPAFPEPGLSGLPNGDFIQGREGMTLRDYFAAKAMAAIIGEMDFNNPDFIRLGPKPVSEGAYIIADAMLAARK